MSKQSPGADPSPRVAGIARRCIGGSRDAAARWCIAAVASVLLAAPAAAQVAVLDETFGVAGRVSVPIGPGDDDARAVVVDEAGRILIAGVVWGADGSSDFGVLRLDETGAPDATFGEDGVVVVSVGAGSSGASAVAAQDGVVVLAGYTFAGGARDTVVVRLLDDGTRDQTFGDAGVVVAHLADGDDVARAVSIDATGKVVVAGWADGIDGAGDARRAVLARFDGDGLLDPAFGIDGVLAFGLDADVGADVGEGVDTEAVALARVGAGLIVVGTAVGPSTTPASLLLARAKGDGRLDETFGAGGVVRPIGTAERGARAVAVDASGDIIVAGRAQTGGGDDPLVARFGSGGDVVDELVAPWTTGDESETAAGVLVLDDGTVLAAGASGGDVVLARVTSTGTFELARAPGCSSSDQVVGIALLRGGDVVVATKCWDGDGHDFGALRFVLAAASGEDGGGDGSGVDGEEGEDGEHKGDAPGRLDVPRPERGPRAGALADGCGCAATSASTSWDVAAVGGAVSVAALLASSRRRRRPRVPVG